MPPSRTTPTRPRSAVVTGAARGIGRATAVELVRLGYEVVVSDLDAVGAAATAAEIGAHSGMALDVRDPDANRQVAAVARDIAPLGAWVCNAGVAFDSDLVDLTDGQVRLSVDVNVLGVMWGMRAAADVFRDQAAIGVRGGEIGVVASLSAHAPVPNLSVYAATKAAVLSLTTSVASELRADGIRVHAVCPDGVATAMVDGFDVHGGTRAILAAGVMLTPEQVARELVAMFGTRRVYRTMPVWRGVVARAASLSPAASMHADPLLRRIGARRLRRAGLR
ncbi:SDR family oxidoreductase [Aeromicrobium fastidiosum]|uniref:SDR family oxidoreductase n=1 Tax=Aeromicrobium fastidiosum TaxID=52699 RepID=A0A641AL68_9ACTN|nr:SDR family oxidoreductase [Aeromicrobium fastidiosum]KAA1376430.1 SDR family oxidoreductase [Aeromicrobium fastidiosum]MBP2391656.1 NAD(P)-dependent dehydrogenase (short-subunit alcohol dehydrogenase family) [Aeromicrobium fastidiosum]